MEFISEATIYFAVGSLAKTMIRCVIISNMMLYTSQVGGKLIIYIPVRPLMLLYQLLLFLIVQWKWQSSEAKLGKSCQDYRRKWDNPQC